MNGQQPRQRGVFALWLAVLLPALILLFALLLESIYLFAIRHRQQTATDAAVLAAAYQVLRRDEPALDVAAAHAAASNGFTVGTDTTLTADYPPVSGAYAGNMYSVRATMDHHAARLFTAVIPGMDPLIGTSATARFRRATCVMTLAPTTDNSFNVAADAVIEAPYCNMQVNSVSTIALRVRNRARMTMLDIRVVGSAGILAGATVTPSPLTGMPSLADPMLSVPEPVVGSCNYTNFVVNGTVTLSPGTYCNGIRINAGARANLQPGNYVIAGGLLDLRNNATISGSGVALFLMQGARLTTVSTANLLLSPSSTGTYSGVVIFESRSAPLDTLTHVLPMTTSTVLEGLVYLPRSALSLTSSTATPANSTSRGLAIIARNVNISGRVRINFDPLYVPEPVRYRAWLIE